MNGHYTGKDGREWKVKIVDGLVYFQRNGGEDWPVRELRACDLKAARAALDELIEGEWVEIDEHRRIRPDGSEPTIYTSGFTCYSSMAEMEQKWVDAYRAGHAQRHKVAQELAEAVLGLGGIVDPDTGWPDMILVKRAVLEHIRALARKVVE